MINGVTGDSLKKLQASIYKSGFGRIVNILCFCIRVLQLLLRSNVPSLMDEYNSPSVHPSVGPSACLSIYLSFYLFNCVHLSVCNSLRPGGLQKSLKGRRLLLSPWRRVWDLFSQTIFKDQCYMFDFILRSDSLTCNFSVCWLVYRA